MEPRSEGSKVLEGWLIKEGSHYTLGMTDPSKALSQISDLLNVESMDNPGSLDDLVGKEVKVYGDFDPGPPRIFIVRSIENLSTMVDPDLDDWVIVEESRSEGSAEWMEGDLEKDNHGYQLMMWDGDVLEAGAGRAQSLEAAAGLDLGAFVGKRVKIHGKYTSDNFSTFRVLGIEEAT